jgi:hypothetical protein
MTAAQTLKSSLGGTVQVSTEILGVARTLMDLRDATDNEDQRKKLSDAIGTLIGGSSRLIEQAGAGGDALVQMIQNY